MFAAKNELFTTPSGYQIQRSLRFRSSASAYLNRTPASSSGQQTFTISAWVKRGTLSTQQVFFGINSASTNIFTLGFLSGDTLRVFGRNAGTDVLNLTTTAVFRDSSAWYHIVLAVDTTQATAANRARMYVNGVEVTAFGTATYPAQNTSLAWNSNSYAHEIGRESTGNYLDGYLTEINSISGTQLTPSSFGAINPVTGVWSATKYNGTYGTNGFYLNFTDNSAATATTIGKDYSGNGNNWTPNNISVTAGVTYDSMLDVPLGAGGGERGNYAVLNPLETGAYVTQSNGNLTNTGNTATNSALVLASIGGLKSGKWYWEYTQGTVGSETCGIVTTYTAGTSLLNGENIGTYGIGARATGTVYGGTVGSITSWTTGDVIGLSVDCDNGAIYWSKNGTYLNSGVPTSGASKTGAVGVWTPSSSINVQPAFGGYNTGFVSVTFGQRPFAYTPPTGFKALHTGNLAAPVIALPAQNMAATIYTGTGATQSISNAVNSVSMQPDWVWFKRRGAVENHWLTDSVRGSTKGLFSNLTDAEATRTDQLTSFNSNGFTLGADAAGYSNVSGQSYVAWQWKAGGTAVSNTSGSITSSVSANTTAGFSVVTYTGTGTGTPTIGHGLGVAPSMVIAKTRSTANGWLVYHQSLGATQSIILNGTNAATTQTDWGNTTPTSTVFYVNGGNTNISAATYVAYCFAPVAGYSAFGSYTGNGSTDGPFIYTGFRPRFIMIKGSSFVSNWFVIDTSRSSYNVSLDALRPNLDGAETSTGTYSIDILSNGFKLRTSAADSNTSSATFIYACFAENPFKYANAR